MHWFEVDGFLHLGFFLIVYFFLLIRLVHVLAVVRLFRLSVCFLCRCILFSLLGLKWEVLLGATLHQALCIEALTPPTIWHTSG